MKKELCLIRQLERAEAHRRSQKLIIEKMNEKIRRLVLENEFLKAMVGSQQETLIDELAWLQSRLQEEK